MKQLWSPLLCLASALILTAEQEIQSLGDLREIEKKIQSLVAKATPATISLISKRVGASGSGVIVTEDGLILTAAHVVKGSREMTVLFPDGREERARILGANFNRDAAMVQLIGKGPWPFVSIGESDTMKTGDLVIAMGHPSGFDPTRRPPVRFGRLMARGEHGFITTDCTVIAGDSGGPLFNLMGELVGIHSHIDPREKKINNHAGISGFLRSWKKMKEAKQWGKLGANYQNPEHPALGIIFEEDESGVKVTGFPPDSPALQAGLQVGDLIRFVAGQPILNFSTLGESLIDFEPSDQVEVVLKRDEKEVVIKIKLARRQQVFRRIRR